MDSKKLAPWFVGPFDVEQVVNPAANRLRLPVSIKVHLNFHVSWVKPVTEPADDPSPVRIIDGALAYTMERILDVRRRGGQYLVEWEGCGPAERL